MMTPQERAQHIIQKAHNQLGSIYSYILIDHCKGLIAAEIEEAIEEAVIEALIKERRYQFDRLGTLMLDQHTSLDYDWLEERVRRLMAVAIAAKELVAAIDELDVAAEADDWDHYIETDEQVHLADKKLRAAVEELGEIEAGHGPISPS